MVGALQHGQLYVALGVLESDLHVLMEEVRVVLAHGLQELHVLHGAVHHRAAVRRDDAVGKVEAALDRALEQGAARLAQEVGHVIGGNVHGAGVGRVETDGKGPVEIQQRFWHVLAGVGHADLALGLGLGDQLVIGLLQQVLEVEQML